MFGSSGELGIAELGDAEELFDTLAGAVPWREERMRIYDSTVRVPRLLAGYAPGEALPHPVLDDARSALNAHYAEELGEPFVSVGLGLRPKAGGPGLRLGVGHGDLLVMGGSCQRTWLHGIPKVASCLGARISIQFRPQWGSNLGNPARSHRPRAARSSGEIPRPVSGLR